MSSRKRRAGIQWSCHSEVRRGISRSVVEAGIVCCRNRDSSLALRTTGAAARNDQKETGTQTLCLRSPEPRPWIPDQVRNDGEVWSSPSFIQSSRESGNPGAYVVPRSAEESCACSVVPAPSVIPALTPSFPRKRESRAFIYEDALRLDPPVEPGAGSYEQPLVATLPEPDVLQGYCV